MVSKIAVMALVAVVAVPILMGYGLNINTEDRQIWTENDDPLNAKDYLITTFDATGATFVDADIYQMNSNNFIRNSLNIYPDYVQTSGTKTPIRLLLGSHPIDNPNFTIYGVNGYGQVIINGGYDANNYYSIKLWHEGSNWGEYSHIKMVIYHTDGSVDIVYDYSYGGHRTATKTDVTSIDFTVTGTSPGDRTLIDLPNAPYVKLSKGYRLNMDGIRWDPANLNAPQGVLDTYIEISQTTQSALLTLNLDSITDSDAMFRIYDGQGYLHFKKTTTAGVVKWEYTPKIYDLSMQPYDFQEIYYNPLSSNTYQVYLDSDYTGELRYVGAWSDTFGAVSPMITYPFELEHNPYVTPREFINTISILGQSPVMRIDAARVGAYDYRVMEDAVYDPAAFRANPITTMTNGLRFGQSLEFGGNTYLVTKGNITIGTHDFSLEGMTFESVQVGGQYENRINGNTVSTTAAPSTLTLNGKWLADVTTESQSLETVSDTKWEPGKFAWNGIDTDFKIAGLMASLGAFIALAVYGRRSGAKVMPLLVVCGGAALMFLVMI